MNARAAVRPGRRALLRGLGAGLAGMLPAAAMGAPATDSERNYPADRVGGTAGAMVPPALVRLADHGGSPGAAPQELVRAFGSAFGALSRAGGGTLLVAPGLYDFGVRLDADPVILCRGLRNVAISAYGARFRLATRARAMPSLFYFFNFSNLTLAGAEFVDAGFLPWINWQGMYCVGLQADAASSGFAMLDCRAERVVGLLASNNNAATRRHLARIRVRAQVRDAYYGVGASFIREGVEVVLDCHNVRRAFIAQSLKDADLSVRVSADSVWPGSNGLVALISGGASEGDVENVRVRVEVRGACIHASYVHFYHQGPEPYGAMRDIDATVKLLRVDGARALFTFDHETDGVAATTRRSWDRIALHGEVVGAYDGEVVSNPTRSLARGSVMLDRNLAQLMRGRRLASNFRIGTSP